MRVSVYARERECVCVCACASGEGEREKESEKERERERQPLYTILKYTRGNDTRDTHTHTLRLLQSSLNNNLRLRCGTRSSCASLSQIFELYV